jgi:beta-glucosidase
MKRLSFPKGFKWGVATAAHQNEGNNFNNDFWAWEQDPAHIADGSKSGLACNWWEHAEEDIDRAAGLGLNALRLSVEWSRLEPEEGRWEPKAFARYREMLTYLLEKGISPHITLHHFTNPLWLAEKGGWAHPEVVELFERFAEKVAQELGDLCEQWSTINEPSVYAALAYVAGRWYPGQENLSEALKVMRHQILAHHRAYEAVKRIRPEAEVGPVHHLIDFAPSQKGLPHRLAVSTRAWMLNWLVPEGIAERRFPFPLSLNQKFEAPSEAMDYIGINYYGRHLLKFSTSAWRALFTEEVDADPAKAWPEPWADREIHPHGLYELIMEVDRRYGKPIYITENGLADASGTKRPEFLLRHLAEVHRAIQAGADVRGFFHWTLVDNYEWTEGWETRFGLFALDPNTQKRSPRRSALLIREIVQAHAITEQIVDTYLGESAEQFWDAYSG